MKNIGNKINKLCMMNEFVVKYQMQKKYWLHIILYNDNFIIKYC